MDRSSKGAVPARTQYVDVNGRRLAYRSVGVGKPMVLCTRFRGNMDLWDPLFLDSLALAGFRVITFDYSGLGLSTGEKNYDPVALARDADDLIEALDLEEAVIGGWSLGGLAAQAFIALYPQRVTHAMLCTGPPGRERQGPGTTVLRHGVEACEHVRGRGDPVLRTAISGKPRGGKASHERIAQRTDDRSTPVPIEFAVSFLGTGPRNPIFPAEAVLEALKPRRSRSCTWAAITTSRSRLRTGTRSTDTCQLSSCSRSRSRDMDRSTSTRSQSLITSGRSCEPPRGAPRSSAPGRSEVGPISSDLARCATRRQV